MWKNNEHISTDGVWYIPINLIVRLKRSYRQCKFDITNLLWVYQSINNTGETIICYFILLITRKIVNKVEMKFSALRKQMKKGGKIVK